MSVGHRTIVYLRWIDSCLFDAQHDPSDSPTPTVIESVGFLIQSTEDYVSLTRDIHDDGDQRGALAVPRSAIVRQHRSFINEPDH